MSETGTSSRNASRSSNERRTEATAARYASRVVARESRERVGDVAREAVAERRRDLGRLLVPAEDEQREQPPRSGRSAIRNVQVSDT